MATSARFVGPFRAVSMAKLMQPPAVDPTLSARSGHSEAVQMTAIVQLEVAVDTTWLRRQCLLSALTRFAVGCKSAGPGTRGDSRAEAGDDATGGKVVLDVVLAANS